MRAVSCWCCVLLMLGTALPSAQSVSVSEPRPLTDVDMGKLKGSPAILTWSPTEGEYYLQTIDSGQKHHYVFRAGAEAQPVQEEPQWATTYWNWKSSRNVPGRLDMLIAVTTRREKAGIPTQSLRDRATAMSNGTAAMQGAAGEAIAEENGSRFQTLVLDGEVIGEFKNEPVVPGATFGWSPEKLHAVAYVTPGKQLSLLDVVSKDKRVIAGSRDVSLPAWSLDGTAIIYLQKSGRKKYSVMHVTVDR
jgi:hypothetical protein